MSDPITWGTTHEAQFLSRLGKWHGKTGTSRLALLQGYLRSIQLRKCWGSINAKEIIRIATAYLESEEHYGSQ